jgi:hypothetical protein
LAAWEDDHAYIADPKHVIQVRDMALVISEQGINVVRRDSNGSWQYVIVYQPIRLMMEFKRR